METNRLEAFSDGVLAIIITIMVLELKVPHDPTWEALSGMLPVLAGYVLSFLYVGIYWNNHHHLLYTAEKVTGAVLWCNLHLLFWLSLLPFATGWMGEHPTATLPTAIYGGVLLLSAVAYWVLQQAIIAADGPDGLLRKALGSDWKGHASPVIYLVAIVLSCWAPWAAQALYAAVAAIWFIPDRRIEQAVVEDARS